MAPSTGSQLTSPNGAGVHPNTVAGASSAPPDDHVASCWSRYEHLKYNDVMKNVLLEDVLSRYEFLTRKFDEYVREHEQERVSAQTVLEREKSLQATVLKLQDILNRDPFILVLIDGDGMIFNNQLLKLGEDGGRQAAVAITKAVVQWSQTISECPKDVKVVVRIYANVKGLAKVCYDAGLVDHPAKVEEFASGFTRGKTLCDFVDVGPGKDRADGKIVETFKLHLFDYQCRNVLFGCSHDNGYARLLEEYVDDEEAKSRLTLLEGTPFEKELQTLPFNKHKFDGMFRNSKIVLGAPDLLTGQPQPQRSDSRFSTLNSGLNPHSGMFTPRTGSAQSVIHSPPGGIPAFDGLSLRNTHSRQDSLTSSGATSDSGGAHNSWSKVASQRAKQPLSELIRPPPETREIIKRNKYSQRVDDHLEYDRSEVQRLKKLKACNQHYLGIGCCHYNAGKSDKCPHAHNFSFSPTELKWLRVVARETPCKKGHGCEDLKCIYGHRCPFPVATEGSMRGIGCLNGDDCRFPRSMHGMDTTAVKIKTIR